MLQLSKMGSFTLLAVACLTIMVGCVLAPGLPSIAAALGVENDASWLITLPSLGAVIFAPFAGRLIEKRGARTSLCVGLFFYGLLGFGGIFLHGMTVFGDRVVLGGVTAVVMASGTALISEFYQGHARLSMIAKQGMAIELGGVIFLAVGGVLAGLAWQGPFALYFMAWLFLLMVLAFIPKTPPKQAHVDVGDAKGALAKVRDVYAAAAFSMIVFFVGIIYLPARLHELEVTESQTGYFLAFISLIAVLFAAIMPKITHALHEHGTLVLAFLLYAVSHVIFANANAVPVFVIGATAMGGGFGLSVPLVNHMTIERSHPNIRGRNLAYLSMALFLGQFVTSFLEFVPGPPATTFILAAFLSLIVAICFGGMRLIRRETTY